MNILSHCTRRTEDSKVFDVYWRTGLTIKGRVIVTMSDSRVENDEIIAAELAVTRYLLEDRNVCGHNKSGKGLTIRAGFGAIRKLLREDSDKSYLSPYANFLRTRFAGACVEIENRKIEWANEECDRDVAELLVNGPVLATIVVGNIGEVELTSHALQRYIERAEVSPLNGWRKMVAWARKATRLNHSPKSWRTRLKYQKEAVFAVSHNLEMLLVIAPPRAGRTLPTLVTVHPVEPWLRDDIIRLQSEQPLIA